MSSKPFRAISNEHPITLEPARSRVLVRAGGRIIADTTRAIALRESRYAPVLYIPRADVDMTLLTRTNHNTHCPYKGEASYFSIREGGEQMMNVAWSYETPFEQVSSIAGHLAFYADRVDAIEEWETPRATH